jgi:hypothetical protein
MQDKDKTEREAAEWLRKRAEQRGEKVPSWTAASREDRRSIYDALGD